METLTNGLAEALPVARVPVGARMTSDLGARVAPTRKSRAAAALRASCQWADGRAVGRSPPATRPDSRAEEERALGPAQLLTLAITQGKLTDSSSDCLLGQLAPAPGVSLRPVASARSEGSRGGKLWRANDLLTGVRTASANSNTLKGRRRTLQQVHHTPAETPASSLHWRQSLGLASWTISGTTVLRWHKTRAGESQTETDHRNGLASRSIILKPTAHQTGSSQLPRTTPQVQRQRVLQSGEIVQANERSARESAFFWCCTITIKTSPALTIQSSARIRTIVARNTNRSSAPTRSI